jgi:hypothetical protein
MANVSLSVSQKKPSKPTEIRRKKEPNITKLTNSLTHSKNTKGLEQRSTSSRHVYGYEPGNAMCKTEMADSKQSAAK